MLKVTSDRSTNAQICCSTLPTDTPEIAAAASAVKPPRNTDKRSKSSCSPASRSWYDQSTASRNVRCRRGASARVEVSRRNRSSRRTLISVTDIVLARAAASSMASGRPSRRRQISITATSVGGSSSIETPFSLALVRNNSGAGPSAVSGPGSGSGST